MRAIAAHRFRLPLAVGSALGWPALLVALVAGGCDLPGQPDPKTRPSDERERVAFEPLYQAHCAGCHGAQGKLGPAPPLADPLFLAIVPDDALLRAISRGRAGTPMPAFAIQHGGKLSEKQVQSLVDGLKRRWGTNQPAPKSTPSYLVSPRARATVEQRQRAKRVFAAACAPCHGSQGQGTDGGGAIRDREFLQLTSDQTLRRIIITGRSDLGMPNFSDRSGRDDDFQPLTDQDIDDLLSLLVAWRHE